MPNATDPCSGGVALFLLRNERNDTAKKELLQKLIGQCAIKLNKKNNKGNNNGGKKTKRKMSWYNACIKEEGKEAMMNGTCKKDNLSDSQIKKYQKIADDLYEL